jgi:predicted lipoprotein
MKRIVLVFALLFYPMTSSAEPSKQEISLKVVQDFVIPAYNELAKRSIKQTELWNKTCETGQLAKAYQTTADAWAAVQHLNFGPVTLLLRRDRLYHWPERRNAVSKGLNKILSAKDPTILSADNFSTTSVAVQGFPALERLLYKDLMTDEFSCKVGKAIATSISEIAQGAAADWVTTLQNIKSGQPHPIYFESMDEVAIRLFTIFIHCDFSPACAWMTGKAGSRIKQWSEPIRCLCGSRCRCPGTIKDGFAQCKFKGLSLSIEIVNGQK